MPKEKTRIEDAPWADADPSKRIAINIPFSEATMVQMDYLKEHRAITSKSSFIREVVERACSEEVKKLRDVQEALKIVQSRKGRSA